MKTIALGQVISKQRKAKGMTQFELAEKMEVTDKAVSKWERGEACPDVASLAKLAGVLEVSSDELLALVPVDGTRARGDKKQPVSAIVNLALIGIGLAMGIAVAVLNIVGEAGDARSSLVMLGIGVGCFGLYLLDAVDAAKNV